MKMTWDRLVAALHQWPVFRPTALVFQPCPPSGLDLVLWNNSSWNCFLKVRKNISSSSLASNIFKPNPFICHVIFIRLQNLHTSPGRFLVTISIICFYIFLLQGYSDHRVGLHWIEPISIPFLSCGNILLFLVLLSLVLASNLLDALESKKLDNVYILEFSIEYKFLSLGVEGGSNSGESRCGRCKCNSRRSKSEDGECGESLHFELIWLMMMMMWWWKVLIAFQLPAILKLISLTVMLLMGGGEKRSDWKEKGFFPHASQKIERVCMSVCPSEFKKSIPSILSLFFQIWVPRSWYNNQQPISINQPNKQSIDNQQRISISSISFNSSHHVLYIVLRPCIPQEISWGSIRMSHLLGILHRHARQPGMQSPLLW